MAQVLVDNYDHIIFDLDGVLYLGDQAIPEAAAAVRQVRDSGRTCAFATNNASKTGAAVAAKLTKLGIEAEASEVVTAADVGVELLKKHCQPGASVFVVGSDMLRQLTREAGYHVVGTDTDLNSVAAVIQGFSPDISWRDLAYAAHAIGKGATWVGTNSDAAIPLPEGPAPGNGALIGAISAATGQQPPTAGKPGPAMFIAASQGHEPSRTLMVGDRLGTDMVGANQLGIHTLNVLSGVTGEAELQAALLESRPMFIGRNVAALHNPPVPLNLEAQPADCGHNATDQDLTALAERVRRAWQRPPEAQ